MRHASNNCQGFFFARTHECVRLLAEGALHVARTAAASLRGQSILCSWHRKLSDAWGVWSGAGRGALNHRTGSCFWAACGSCDPLLHALQNKKVPVVVAWYKNNNNVFPSWPWPQCVQQESLFIESWLLVLFFFNSSFTTIKIVSIPFQPRHTALCEECFWPLLQYSTGWPPTVPSRLPLAVS